MVLTFDSSPSQSEPASAQSSSTVSLVGRGFLLYVLASFIWVASISTRVSFRTKLIENEVRTIAKSGKHLRRPAYQVRALSWGSYFTLR